MTEQPTTRLSPEREQKIRERLRSHIFPASDGRREGEMAEVLAELDAVRETRDKLREACDERDGIISAFMNHESATIAAANECVQALEARIHQVRLAWNRVGRCEDEFLPEQPDACSEVRDMFDAAVSALLLHAEGIRPLAQTDAQSTK